MWWVSPAMVDGSMAFALGIRSKQPRALRECSETGSAFRFVEYQPSGDVLINV